MPSPEDANEFMTQAGQTLPIPIQRLPQFSSLITSKAGSQAEEWKKVDAEFDEWRKSLSVSVVTSIDDILSGGPGGSSSLSAGGSSGLRGPRGLPGPPGPPGPAGSQAATGGFFEAVAAANTAGGGETTLLTASLPAGTLGTDGDLFFIDVLGQFGAVVSTNKRVRVKFGGVTVYDTFALTGWENLKFHIKVMIIRLSVASQSITAQTVEFPVQYTTTSQDLDNAIIPVELTGAGTNANDVVTVCWKGRVVH